MKISHFKLLLVTGLLLLASQSSCSISVSEGTDVSDALLAPILLGEPCSPPCWYGLVPGVSTEEDVLAAISDLPFLLEKTVNTSTAGVFSSEENKSVTGTSITVNCSFSGNLKCIDFILIERQLDSFTMGSDGQTTVERVIFRLGQPDFIIVFPVSTPRFVCRIQLIWLEAQLTAIYTERDTEDAVEFCNNAPNGLRISRSFIVDSFYYYSLASLEMLQNQEFALPWPGFSD